MAITSVASATFVADSVNLIRDNLATNITDPITSKRVGNEKFVMTSYPKRPVKYPLITVVDSGVSQPIRLGMQSEGTAITLPLEIRIWARNVVERDELFDSVYNYLRTNQFSGDDITGANLHDFSLTSAVNVDEPGKEGIKSKVMSIQYLFICS